MYSNCSDCCSPQDNEKGEGYIVEGSVDVNVTSHRTEGESEGAAGYSSHGEGKKKKTVRETHSRWVCTGISDCCAPYEEEGIEISGEQRIHITEEDRSKGTQISEEVQRKWKPVTTYQPVDTVTKVIEIPIKSIKEKYVPKVVLEEKVTEVPKYIYEREEKIVEVPEIKYVDKIVEIPQYHYQYKYVPKIETKENIVQKPKVEVKYIEKVVEVPQIKEVIRYQDVETVEEVIKYIPKGQEIPKFWSESGETIISRSETATEKRSVAHSVGPRVFHEARAPNQTTIPGTPFLAYPSISQASEEEKTARIEQIFKPKVVKSVEIQKHVPISVDVPVPYMVPKPLLVPVHVPVLKFRDHFIPVPVRRVVVPKIKWTNEVFVVECNREKPFLQIQDVIKPVPCDVEINVHEYVDKAQPINPTELSQADVHAMWMRVNADLAETKKQEMGDNYPSVRHPPGTTFGEPGTGSQKEGDDVTGDPEAPQNEDSNEEVGKEESGEQSSDPMALHPGHPLAMTYLQNRWIKKTTTDTQDMYTKEWFDTHQKALYGMVLQNPTQVQLSPERASVYKPESAAFGNAQWSQVKAHTMEEFEPTGSRVDEESTQKVKSTGCSPCCGEVPED